MNLVLYENPGFFDFESYWEPQERTACGDTHHSTYDYREVADEDDDYYYSTGGDGNSSSKGCGNWLGDYEFFFGGGYLEQSEAYSGTGCQDYGVYDSNSSCYNTCLQQDNEDQWDINHGLCSEGNSTEDYGEEEHDFSCFSRWDEALLYERIFGGNNYDTGAE